MTPPTTFWFDPFGIEQLLGKHGDHIYQISLGNQIFP